MKFLSTQTFQCGITVQGSTTLAGTTYLTGITNTASWDYVVVGTSAQGQLFTRTYAQLMSDISSGITLSLDGLSDVVAPTPLTGQLLRYNGVQWANWTPTYYSLPAGGTTLQYIDGTGALQTFPSNLPTSSVKHQVKAGVAINKGQAVYVTGADGTNMVVGLASNASEATSSKTMGLLDATVSTNGFANVVTEGLLAGLDTSTAGAAGDPVWLGTGGNLIYGLINKPYAPAHLVFIGIVTRKNNSNGEIFVKVQNGFELNEIHDVDLITTAPINGHLLGYNGTLWVNKTIAGWLGYTPANASGTTNYISKFTGSTTLGNSQIFDNGTNVGIGTTSPSKKLEVVSNTTYDGIQISGASIPTLAIIDTTNNAKLVAYVRDSDATIGMETNHPLTINTNNTERVRITSAGNVGIGTTNPIYKLDVNGSFNALTSGVYLTYNSGIIYHGSSYYQFPSGSYYLLYGRTGMGLIFGSNNAEVGRFDLSGNLGIGTTSPSQKLDVQGDISVGVSGATTVHTYYNSTTRNQIVYTNNSSFEFHEGANERVRIAAGGNVGIGTTSPAYKFQVAGGDIAIDYNRYLRGGSGGDWNLVNLYNGATGDMEITMLNASWYLRHNANASFAGKVGIGTTSPGAKLDISTTSGTSVFKTLDTTTAYKSFSIDYSSSFITQVNFGLFGRFEYEGNGGILSIENRSTQAGSSMMRFVMGTTERMRITDTGNVGIGTTTPTQKLSVETGNVGFTNGYGVSWDSDTEWIKRSASGDQLQFATQSTVRLNVGNTQGQLVAIGLGANAASAQLQVRGAGTTSSTTALRVENSSATARLTILDDGTSAFNTSHLYISSSGNIGVGKTNPAYALDVSGSGNFTEDVYISGSLEFEGTTNNLYLASSTDVRNWYLTGKNFNVSSQDGSSTGIYFKSDGTRFYIIGTSADRVFQYDLSTAWDVSTAVYNSVSLLVSSQDSTPNDIFISPDGTILFMLGDTNDRVYRYNLSSAWDVSSATFVNFFSVSAQESNPNGLYFDPTGTNMYVIGTNGDDVNQYTLGTAWDLTTVSFLQTFSVSSRETTPTAISFNNAGTRMYILGQSGDDITEYRLSTAWDISTATFFTTGFTGPETSPGGLYYNETYEVAYIVGSSADVVYGLATTPQLKYYGDSFIMDSQMFVGGRTEIAGTLYVNNTITATSTITTAGSLVSSNASFSTSTISLGTGTSTTTVNIGGNASLSSTNRFGYGAITSGLTKTIEIGTGGLSGSTTNTIIGSGVSGGKILLAQNTEFAQNATVRTTLNVDNNANILDSAQSASGEIVVFDTFTEASNTLLNLHTPNTGSGWSRDQISTFTSPTMTVFGATNTAGPTANVTDQGVIYRQDTALTTPNYEVSVDLVTQDSSDDVLWLFARYQDVNNFYGVAWSTTQANCRLVKRVGGTFTTLATLSVAPITGATTLSIRVLDNLIVVLNGGNIVMSVFDISITNAGYAAIGGGNIGQTSTDDFDATWKFDNFMVRYYQAGVQTSNITGGLNISGTVGIGTTSPTTKLDVNGVITATGGNSTNWNTAYGWGNHASAGYLTTITRAQVHYAIYSTGGDANGYTAFGIYRNYAVNGPIGGHNTILNVAQYDGNYGFQLGADTVSTADGLYYRSKDTTVGTWRQVASREWVNAQAFIPQARTLTINGTAYDLTANRSWTIANDLQTAANGVKVTTPVNTGANVIASLSVGSYDGATFNYVIKDGTNYRAGTVIAVWNGTIVQYTETTTNDIGNTTSVVMSVAITAGNAQLIATSGTSGWTAKVVPLGI